MGSQGSTRPYLSFHLLVNPQRRLTEHRYIVIITIVVYHSKTLQIKISKDKRYIGQNPGETRYKLLAIFSQWRHTVSE